MTMPSPDPVNGAANGAGNGTTGTAPGIELAAVLLRAVRFESQLDLGAPVSAPPQVAVTAGYQQEPLANGAFAVVLVLRAVGRAGEAPLFTAGIEQTAVVKTAGLAAGEAADWVAARAPARLYPYARQALEDLLGNSQFTGFRLGVSCPPLVPVAPGDAAAAG